MLVSDDMRVTSKGSDVVSASVESDVHPLVGGAKASLSFGLDFRDDCSSAGPPEKASDALDVAVGVKDASFPARGNAGGS